MIVARAILTAWQYHPQYQRHDIGRQLVKEVEKYMNNHDIEVITSLVED